MFLTCAKKLDQKQFIAVSLISSLILALLVFLILSVIDGGDMPMLQVSKDGGFFVPFVLALFCGVTVSLISCSYTVVKWLNNNSGDNVFLVLSVYICAYVVSLFGFGKILAVVLPVCSVFALLFVFFGVIKLLKNKGNV